MENKKVFIIVYRFTGGALEILILKPNPEPGRYTDYYVVTGGIEKGETSEQAALREASEEIGITPIRLIDLNHTIRYQDHITAKKYTEHCFAAEVDDSKIILNEEHIGYKWVSPEDFVRTIWWEDGNRAELSNMIGIIKIHNSR